MKKIIQRSIAVLLCVTALILLLIPSSNVEASFEKGDYTLDGSTLEKYNGTESDITIPLGVTKIGKEAFAGNNYLRSVYIPDGITSIDFSAFENCKNLEKVVLGNDVKSIGQSVFSGCQSLKVINIPRYVEEIGSGALAACPSLSSVNIDPQNRHFICLDGVIYTKDGNKMVQYLAGRPYSTYDIPYPVTEIGEFGFYGANMLTNVNIIDGVKEIPDYTFLNCNALNNVTIPKTVEAIRKGAFGGCPNLTHLAIPAEVRYIDPDAFTSISGQKGDMTDSNTGAVLSESNDTSFNSSSNSDVIANSKVPLDPSTAPANLTDISDYIETADSDDIENNNVSQADDSQNSSVNSDSNSNENSNSESLQNLADKIKEAATNITKQNELGQSTIVGGQAVIMMDPDSFTVMGFDINEAQTEDSIADSGNQTSDGSTVRDFSGNEFDTIKGILGNYNGKSSTVNIPSDVQKIGNRVFYKNKDINEVVLPGGIKEIGDFAFARSSINKITIPDGVEKIGYASFLNCSNLTDLAIPSSVKTIELGALDGTGFINNFKEIEDGNDFLIVGDGILVNYKGFGGNVVIPNGVKKIGPGVFEGISNLKSVEIPETVTDICEDAFNGCRDLQKVSLPSHLVNIEDRAFKDTGLNKVIIPPSVEKIGLGAFDTTSVNGGMEYVSFSSATLPDVAYKPTASRLSAYNLRTDAFEGTPYAFVIDKANINSGNIFDAHEYGFKGEVVSLLPEENDGIKQLELKKVTDNPDQNGYVMIKGNTTIDGIPYMISGVRESAFNEYNNQDWCSKNVEGILIDGNNSDALNELINKVPINNITNEPLSINIDSSLNISKSQISATIPGVNDNFKMAISNGTNNQNDFILAFNNRYGHSENVVMNNISIDLSDKYGAIPIHKMADSKMEMIVPVPDSMKENEGIRVATLDDNGLLEDVTSEIIFDEDGKNDKIRFVASHLSPFCIYYFNDDSSLFMAQDLNVISETVDIETSKGAQLSDTIVVKTLNRKVGRIQTKVIIAVLLFAIAGLLFVFSFEKRIIKK